MKALALITGGTSGLGFACALELACDYNLALAYANNDTKAQAALKEITEKFPDCQIELFKQVLNGFESSQKLYDQVQEKFDTCPSILVNCAGRIQDGLFLSTDFSVQEEMINEHLTSTMALSQLCAKGMYREKFGRIVNFSSVSAKYYKKGQVTYAAVKSAIEGFTKCFAIEVAHRGVTVNALAPGLIETPMTAQIIANLRENKLLKKKIPAARAGKPEEVGKLVSYLCSKDAGYITGTVITIDGGRSLGDISA
jgi:3-oxoacyl-[acyl-carrier protein] reductase